MSMVNKTGSVSQLMRRRLAVGATKITRTGASVGHEVQNWRIHKSSPNVFIIEARHSWPLSKRMSVAYFLQLLSLRYFTNSQISGPGLCLSI